MSPEGQFFMSPDRNFSEVAENEPLHTVGLQPQHLGPDGGLLLLTSKQQHPAGADVSIAQGIATRSWAGSLGLEDRGRLPIRSVERDFIARAQPETVVHVEVSRSLPCSLTAGATPAGPTQRAGPVADTLKRAP